LSRKIVRYRYSDAHGRERGGYLAPFGPPVVSWILEWGPHARAIAPDDLVVQVRSELKQACEQYDQPALA
jgi:hypothetical protein